MFFAAAAIRLWNGGGEEKGETGSIEGIGLRPSSSGVMAWRQNGEGEKESRS